MADAARQDPARPHGLVPPLVGDAAAAAAIVVAAFAPFPISEFRPGSPLLTAIVLIPAVLLPLRRRWPIAVVAACVAVYGVAALAGVLAPGVVLATAISTFGAANRSSRRTTIVVSALTASAVLLLSLLARIGTVVDPRILQFAVVVAFAAAAGDATRSRREYIRAMAERAERAEQSREAEARRRVSEERLRIARDLHDAVAHRISVISLNAGVASSSLESRPEKAREALGSIRSAAREVLGEIGDLLSVLRSEEDGAAPDAAPEPGLDRLPHLVRQFADTGLDVDLRVEGDLSSAAGATDLVAYRVVQEALTNAHKHGSEHRADVLLRVGERDVTIVVANPVSRAGTTVGDATAGGHGLLGLRERVASVRGAVETQTISGGYRLSATLPLPEEATR